MKILTVSQIKEADYFTIKHEPISSIDLMERAATACFNWILEVFPEESFHVVVGKGNNGGDGLVIARLLHQAGLNVRVSTLNYTEQASDEFIANYARLVQLTENIHQLNSDESIEISKNEILIDAIFGIGLSRNLTRDSWLGQVVLEINENAGIVVSIDVPSGLFPDNHTPVHSAIIEATYTLTFQTPKLSFMYPENEGYVGDFRILEIGLSLDYFNSVDTDTNFILSSDIESKRRHRGKFSHKGSNGRGLLIVGSEGKMGAGILAARAALRSGIGLLTAKVPQGGMGIIQTSVPECMAIGDQEAEINSVLPVLESKSSVGIGPGLGQHKLTHQLLSNLLDSVLFPIVIDADAINMIANDRQLLRKIPKGSILTPHVKEFERLVGPTANTAEAHQKQREFCQENQCIIILKGAHTCICDEKGRLHFNSTGNPGMATAGSGDVLTGIITSLLAQGYCSISAAICAVFFHGLAGDYAFEEKGIEGMLSGDLIDKLPTAIKSIWK